MRRYLFAMVVGCFAVAGCGKTQPDLTEVEGTLKFRGKPMPGFMVQFFPDAPKDTVVGMPFPISMGFTDDQGHYQLTCQAPPLPGAVL